MKREEIFETLEPLVKTFEELKISYSISRNRTINYLINLSNISREQHFQPY